MRAYGVRASSAINNNNNNNLIRNDLEIHEARNISDRNQCFGASCAIIKVT